MKALLSAKKLSKNFDTLKVLDSVSLVVAEQEIVAIVGPSGAGKTTLLHLLGTLDKANSNPESSLFLDGVDITQLSDKAIAQFRNQKMGFIFQCHELLPDFTALENVCLPTWLGCESQKNAVLKAM